MIQVFRRFLHTCIWKCPGHIRALLIESTDSTIEFATWRVFPDTVTFVLYLQLLMSKSMYMYRIAGNFRMVQIFVYFVCACCVRK